MYILVVEDMKESQYMLEKLLTGKGYEVTTANNGREALARLAASRFDLIISDILMPVMNGFRLCQAVKSNAQWKDIPFIFYTATFVEPNDEKLALNLGATRFVIKPQDNDVFLQIIADILADYERGSLGRELKNSAETEEILALYEYSITKKLDDTVNKLRKKQALLEKSEQRLKEAQELGHIGHWEMDLASRRVFWSDELWRIFGLKPQEFEPDMEQYLAFAHPDDRSRVALKLQELFQKMHELKFSFRVLTKAGQLHYVKQHCQTQYDEEGKAAYHIGTLQDITELTEAEADKLRQVSIIMQTQNLKAMGEMAAGIFHEINQPLTSMIINTQLMLQSLKQNAWKTQELLEQTDTLLHGSIKIRELIEHFRSFSRNQDLQRRDLVDVNQCIRNTIKLFEVQIKQQAIGLECNLAGNLPAFWGNPFLIEQVILNLLSNARDALRAREGSAAAPGDKLIKITSAFASDFIVIIIEDNGSGMSREVAARIFDPFFTTKKEEAGTGLGLFVSLGIIKSLKGEITVESVPAMYTRFTITIPVHH